MRYFKLPDLGEGLQEAEIVEWYVKPGDSVSVDKLLVAVETAKAIVDIPSPCTGIIDKLCGEVGDTIGIGQPLVRFLGEDEDAGTVVGKVETAKFDDGEDFFIIGSAEPPLSIQSKRGHAPLNQSSSVEEGYKKLTGARKSMFKAMTAANEVSRVTIFDDVRVIGWIPGTNFMLKLIQAIEFACKVEPIMNSWFDSSNMAIKTMSNIDVGIAIDTKDGLFVPVIRNVQSLSSLQIKGQLDLLKDKVKNHTIEPQEMTGATITLSNFGTIGGQYATPIVVPPQVCIVGIGGVSSDGERQHPLHTTNITIPISVSFDHRAVTGGEAARFMNAIKDYLIR